MKLNKTKKILLAIVFCLVLSFLLKSLKQEEAWTAGALSLTVGQSFYEVKGKDMVEPFIVQDTEQKEAEDAAKQKRFFTQVPKLPEKGQKLSDFVPEGWELMDSVELDFNKDKITDYVGIMNVIPKEEDSHEYWRGCPRVLFIIAGSKDGSYLLSFHDENLIRNYSEGDNPHSAGVNQITLRADGDGTSFTVCSQGGRSWIETEDNTYGYRDGTWYLTYSEHIYDLYGSAAYEADDWERGVGIRKRSHNLDQSNEHFLTGEESEFDFTYEVSLDEMPTLYQAGRRSWFAAGRVMDKEVKAVVFAEDIDDMEAIEKDELSGKIEEWVKKTKYASYNNENFMIEIYFDLDDLKKYLVMYDWEDKTASVLAKAEADAPYHAGMDNAAWYQGKIYYTTDIQEEFYLKTLQDGAETIVQEKYSVGFILHRMNEDGSGKESIFEYKYPAVSEGALLEKRPPYIYVPSYEISGGEITLDAISDFYLNSYYRMNIDGSNAQLFGQYEE